MRKVINLCLLVVTILLSGAVNAAGKVSVEITNSSVINVSLTKVLKGEKLILKDFYGEVLFNTTLETSSNYQKNFNLSNVPLGLYFVESESLYEIKITPILKNNKGISLIDTSLVTFFKPQVSSENSIVKVLLNNQYLDLRDGSLSLQPKQNGFHSVINLHSIQEGDFNGTVNF